MQKEELKKGNAATQTEGTTTPLASARNTASSKKRTCYGVQKGNILINTNDEVATDVLPKDFQQTAGHEISQEEFPNEQIYPSHPPFRAFSQNSQRPVRPPLLILSPQSNNFEDLYVGGESIRDRPSTTTAQGLFQINPQLQIVKTICSTKNSFLPNFKTKKREYIFGEHKINKPIITHKLVAEAIERSPHKMRISELSQERPQSRTVGARSVSPSAQLNLADMLANTTDLLYLHKLEKLVKHKHKLSNLIKATIIKTTQNNIHILKNQQQSKEPKIIQREEDKKRVSIVSEDLQVGLNLSQYQRDFDFETPLHLAEAQFSSEPVDQRDLFQDPNHHNRAVVVVNQTTPDISKPSTPLELPSQIRRSFINDDVFRQATDEETNYLKFVVNEMKPNYAGNSQRNATYMQNLNAVAAAAAQMMLGTSPDSHKMHAVLNQESLSQIKSGSLVELETGAVGLISGQPLNIIDGKIQGLILNNELEEEDSASIQANLNNLKNNYSFNQIAAIQSQPRAQSQNVQKRKSPRKWPTGEIIEGSASKQRNRNQDEYTGNFVTRSPDWNMSTVEKIPTGTPNTHHNQQPTSHHTLQYNIQNTQVIKSDGRDESETRIKELAQADLGEPFIMRGATVLSDRHSMDSSQYKTIKFQLMIMKSPQNQNPQNDDSSGDPQQFPNNNRAVGGRQSSKNFRKELKRYTLADAFNGYNPNLLLQQQEESTNLANFIRIAPYNFNDDRDVLKRTASALQQKRTKKLISNINMLWKPKAPSISLMAQDDGIEPTFHNPPMTPDLENYDVKSQKGGDRLNIQQASEDTFINSSVAPLSNKMSAKYKAKFGMATQSRTGVAKHTNSDIRGMPTHNQTAIAFLSQELAKNDNARYHNSSGQAIEDLLFGKVDYMNVGGSGHPDQQSKSQLPPSNFMEAIQSAEPLPETQAPKRKSHLIVSQQPRKTATQIQQQLKVSELSNNYDVKSGGEIGGGVFSQTQFISGDFNQNQGKEEESRNKSKISSPNETPVLEGKRPNAGQSALESHQKGSFKLTNELSHKHGNRKRHLNPKNLNTDIHQMITANGKKSRHYNRDSNQNDTGQSKSLNPNLTREDDKQNSIDKSSDLSSATEKKDISLQVDKGIMEASIEASQAMLSDDQMMKHHTLFLKFLQAQLMIKPWGSGEPSQKVHHSPQVRPKLKTNLAFKPKQESHRQQIEGVDGQSLIHALVNGTKSSKVLKQRIIEFLQSTKPINNKQDRLSSKERMTRAQVLSEPCKNPKAHGYGEIAAKELEDGFQDLLSNHQIIPYMQLIRENFQRFAIHNLKMLKEKHEKRRNVHQQIIIDLNQQSPQNQRSQVVRQKSPTPTVLEDEGDVRLSRYIWSTIQQLQQEGYPVDMDLYRNEFQEFTPSYKEGSSGRKSKKPSIIPYLQVEQGAKQFTNNIIQNSNLYQKDSRSHKNSSRLKTRDGKIKVEHNADLQIAYFEHKQRRPRKQNPNEPMRERVSTRSEETLMHQQSKIQHTDGSLQRQEDDNLGTTLPRKTLEQSGLQEQLMLGNTFESQRYKLQSKGNDEISFPKENPTSQTPQPTDNDKIGDDSIILTGKQPHPVVGITIQPVISYKQNQPYRNQQAANLTTSPKFYEHPLSDYLQDFSDGSGSDADATRKAHKQILPFDLNLMKIQPPVLPLQMHHLPIGYPQLQATQIQTKNRSGKRNYRVSNYPLSSFSPTESAKQQRSGGSRVGTAGTVRDFKFRKEIFKEKRQSHPSRQPGFQDIMFPDQQPPVIRENDLRNFRPVTELRLPNQLILQVNEKQSKESNLVKQDADDVFSNSIFYNKEPVLLKDIVPLSNVMHLRNKNQKMLATSGLVSPQQTQCKNGAEASRFSGNEIIIKDLHKIRNRDLLKVTGDERKAIDHTILTKLQADKERPTTKQHRRYLNSEAINIFSPISKKSNNFKAANQLNARAATAFSSLSQTPISSIIQSPIANDTSPSTILTPKTINGRRLNKSGGQFFARIKKGKALEDTVSGVKPSNGIKII
ncbi:hypothetical protein FGO68_gene814 [Halteria grandinella]|uniref:Uncharacterized protein n=1 Tax=Halteria grandinella TaxID=5974 RepID=A0A8J8P7W7_HALGN|nr:hypothetical protein FGO68_gene814 [Halteria grandinella]